MKATQALKTIMKEKNVTNTHLAKQIGVSQPAIAKTFKQSVTVAKLSTLLRELGYKVVVMPSSTPTPEGGYIVE